MKKFSVRVKVPVQVGWVPELVEDKNNFYMKLTPHVYTSGVKGVPRLTRVVSGNTTRYMMVKHFNYNQLALQEAIEKAKKMAKEDPEIKKAIIAGAKGKTVTTPTTPISTKPSYVDEISKRISAEDIAAGGGIGREPQDSRLLSTGFSEKELKKFEKEEEE